MSKTLRLSSSPGDIRKAGEILRRGGIVAMPTETVYGLAASVWNAPAVARIFEAKGRPGDNPLIVHISELSQLDGICEYGPNALKLARAFWPGPLTMVLPKKCAVPDEITAGLSTVAVRMPCHETARELIKAAGSPLAAPSANVSGRPSPTAAEHVFRDLDGRIDAVVDGGKCRVGVESTVVDMTSDVPTVLRPGAVTRAEIAVVLGAAKNDARIDSPAVSAGAVPSPGMKYRHYAPSTPLRLFTGSPRMTARAAHEACAAGKTAVVFNEYAGLFTDPLLLGESWDHASHASRLYDLLREADDRGGDEILVCCPRPQGAGAATVNRLKRAAGSCVESAGGYPVIGVTGPSGSGKSTLTELLHLQGCAVMDADRIYAELLEGSDEMNRELRALFPEAYRSGSFDRKAMAALAFSDERKRLELNRVTHAYVYRETERRLDMLNGPAVLDVPLLFESGMDRMCTCTVGVYAERSALLKRILKRDGIDENSAARRLSASKDRQWYLSRCELVLDNDGSPEELAEKAENLIKEEKLLEK